jgi:chitodextrinase
MDPRAEMHGIVFKWAANSWVRGMKMEMTGSHPIVTEEAKNLQIVNNELDGSWNKGKGGNGYFRGSRVWDSLYAGNTSRNLRHFTFQWSASGNVVIGNDFDSDLNLHGGWERNNLFELNTVRVPYAHRSANCRANCGDEGGGGPDDSNWFPIWWGAGKKAVKWSGASGPRNVFFNNTMTKQTATGGPYTDYYPDKQRIYQFGWNGTAYKHLDVGGTSIADWAKNEQRDYTGGHGVDATKTDSAQSLFLKSVNGSPGPIDNQAPSAPANLRSTSVTSDSVSLEWNAATDNIGVSDYQVLQSGSVVATVTNTSASVTGLSPNTSYQFSVRARDAAGNTSAASSQISVTTSSSGGTAVNVSTAAQLQAALANAAAGQTIKLAAGTYRGSFFTQKAGTAAKPITLTGPSNAILINDGPAGDPPDCPAPTAGWDSGYGLWLYSAPYWNLNGFTVTESKKGIVLDNSHHTVIDGVNVHHVDEEAVHFRRSSADSIIRNSTITDTGLVQKGYGEGVYIGSANSNWECHGNSGGVDKSDRVQVIGNKIGPNIAAEPIDVKEGTFNGVIRGNTFNGKGITGENSADSWIDVKGVGYLIEDNTGTFAKPGTFANGYETHNPGTSPSFPNGCGNTWRNNKSDLGGVGEYAIKITSASQCTANPNKVYASNTVTGAKKGLTNVPTTP